MSQQEAFQARLERIGANKPEQPPVADIPSSSVAIDATSRSVIIEFAMVPVAFFSGLFSVIIALWVQFHYLTDEGEYGLSGGELAGGFLGDIVIAIVVSLILKEILNLKSFARSWAEIGGFIFGFFGLHILVELMPETFANLFSALWVLRALEYV